jgi:hypothetical protein
MKISFLILIALLAAALLLPSSCTRSVKVPIYAQKLPDPGTTDENNPINRYNNAISFNKPICLSVSMQGAT